MDIALITAIITTIPQGKFKCLVAVGWVTLLLNIALHNNPAQSALVAATSAIIARFVVRGFARSEKVKPYAA